MLREFRMPDAGEGLTEAEVLGWRVAVGDVVTVNQVLLEVETAKAAVELPSPYAGTVVELLAAPGDVVPVGEPIIRIDEPQRAGADGAPAPGGAAVAEQEPAGPAGAAELAGAVGAAGSAGAAAPAVPPAADVGPPRTQDVPTGERQAVLVGYGVKAAQAPKRRPRITPHGADHVEAGPPGEPARPVRHGGLELGRAVEARLGGEQVRAKPPVRRLARDLGVDLAGVVPSGPDGSITHEDVTRAAAGGPAAHSGELAPVGAAGHGAGGHGVGGHGVGGGGDPALPGRARSGPAPARGPADSPGWLEGPPGRPRSSPVPTWHG